MSGHSHFSSIKHKKEALDKKRGRVFSKITRLISIAVKEKGSDIETNPKLKMAIDKAKEFNMPKDNIERAIKKGSGDIEKNTLEEITYEAYGPGGVAIIIESITDNKNRTINELKQILSQRGGKIANTGSVGWLFDKKGKIIISKSDSLKEDFELFLIEAGVEDFSREENNELIVYVSPDNLDNLKGKLDEQSVEIKSTSLGYFPKEKLKIDEKTRNSCEKLLEELEENEDTQKIYINTEI